MTKPDLTPANQNPWYVLMTLRGEQEGDEIDWELHKANRDAWNGLMSNTVSSSLVDRFRASGMQLPLRDAHHAAWPTAKDLFWHCWQKRNGLNFPAVELPDRQENVNLRKLKFPNFLVTTGMAFAGSLNINGSTFEKSVYFNRSGFSKAFFAEDAIFKGDFDIGQSIMLDGAYLVNATFEGGIQADDLVVDGNLELKGKCVAKNVNMAGLQVNGKFSMKGLHVHGKLDLERAKFSQRSSFDETIVEGETRFVSAVFSDAAQFVFTKFEQSVSFASVNFQGDAVFRNTRFMSAANFPVAKFDGNAYFTEASFHSEAIPARAAIRFEGATFRKFTSFRDCHFVFEYPEFIEATLYEKTAFTPQDKFWPPFRQGNCQQGKDSCGIIRHAVAKQGLPEDEHFFFRREMELSLLSAMTKADGGRPYSKAWPY